LGWATQKGWLIHIPNIRPRGHDADCTLELDLPDGRATFDLCQRCRSQIHIALVEMARVEVEGGHSDSYYVRLVVRPRQPKQR